VKAIIIGLSILVVLAACKAKQVVNTEQPLAEVLEQTAQEKYGNNYKIIPNSNNTFSLVTHRSKKFSELGFDIDYFILEHKSKAIIQEDFLKSGHIDWIDNNTVKAVKREPDNSGKRNKEVYHFNVKSKAKTIINKS